MLIEKVMHGTVFGKISCRLSSPFLFSLIFSFALLICYN